MLYTIKKIAELARISLRTLRHYDNIGLLTPAERSDSGYRMYSDADTWRSCNECTFLS